MSVSILWRPVPPKDARSLDSSPTSSVLYALRKVFGESEPIHLELGDVEKLRAMAAVDGLTSQGKAYEELAALIEQHEAIQVWGEW